MAIQDRAGTRTPAEKTDDIAVLLITTSFCPFANAVEETNMRKHTLSPNGKALKSCYRVRTRGGFGLLNQS